MDDQEIRTRLKDIDCLNIDKQVIEMKKLNDELGWDVCELVAQTLKENDEGYICHLFTFDIHPSPPTNVLFENKDRIIGIQISSNHCITFESLESRGLLKKVNGIDQASIIVYYFGESEWHIHSGKVEKGKVISKWGKGHVWKHDIKHVPSIYVHDGEVRYHLYKIVDKPQIKLYFYKCLERARV